MSAPTVRTAQSALLDTSAKPVPCAQSVTSSPRTVRLSAVPVPTSAFTANNAPTELSALSALWATRLPLAARAPSAMWETTALCATRGTSGQLQGPATRAMWSVLFVGSVQTRPSAQLVRPDSQAPIAEYAPQVTTHRQTALVAS